MLRCVIFDLDNTLVDSDLDFAQIKAEIGTDMSILEFRATQDQAGQLRVDEILGRHERRAAATCDLLAGARELLDFLQGRGVKTALLTRNSRTSVETVMDCHNVTFDCVVTREDSEPKPSPAPVLFICEKLRVKPANTMMVGDYLYDMQSGKRAGATTMLVESRHRHRFEFDADYEVASLHEALDVVRDMLDAQRRTRDDEGRRTGDEGRMTKDETSSRR